MNTNREAALKWAEFALSEKRLGRRESASGPGSSLASTTEIRAFLQSCIEEFQVQSILDLGCGDWNWMQHVMPTPPAHLTDYVGWDIHPGMIESLQRNFGSGRIRFEVADIFSAPLPPADLVMCRDVLFHVDTGMAAELVRRIMTSSSRLFLSTTFPHEPFNGTISPYLPIEGWGFHRINLDIEPFNLGSRVLRRVHEPRCAHKGNDRYVGLYAAAGGQAPKERR